MCLTLCGGTHSVHCTSRDSLSICLARLVPLKNNALWHNDMNESIVIAILFRLADRSLRTAFTDRLFLFFFFSFFSVCLFLFKDHQFVIYTIWLLMLEQIVQWQWPPSTWQCKQNGRVLEKFFSADSKYQCIFIRWMNQTMTIYATADDNVGQNHHKLYIKKKETNNQSLGERIFYNWYFIERLCLLAGCASCAQISIDYPHRNGWRGATTQHTTARPCAKSMLASLTKHNPQLCVYMNIACIARLTTNIENFVFIVPNRGTQRVCIAHKRSGAHKMFMYFYLLLMRRKRDRVRERECNARIGIMITVFGAGRHPI